MWSLPWKRYSQKPVVTICLANRQLMKINCRWLTSFQSCCPEKKKKTWSSRQTTKRRLIVMYSFKFFNHNDGVWQVFSSPLLSSSAGSKSYHKKYYKKLDESGKYKELTLVDIMKIYKKKLKKPWVNPKPTQVKK